MITPRRIRLHRAATLAAFRTTLTEWILALGSGAVSDTCVLVPTHAAAEQLRRTVETRAFADGRDAVVWPVLTTRRDLYDQLGRRLPLTSAVLTPFEREVMLAAVCRSVTAEGVTLPYALRPALVAEMVGLYDQIRRLGRSVDDFERNFREELAPEQDTDRGAARLLEQTTFLAAAFRAYEARVHESARLDEHALRDVLTRDRAARPLRRIVVTVADRLADPDGMWPADFDLLARLPALECIDLISTESILASGYIERLYAAFPDMEVESPIVTAGEPPTLIVAERLAASHPEPVSFMYRDREEELIAVARRLKQERRDGTAAPLHRTALVVRRPLPYLYVGRHVFTDAGVPFETLDTLPLAAEPYAAALDLVLDAVRSDFTRTSLLALVRSPHFAIGPDDAGAIAACDSALANAGYLGGRASLERLVTDWAVLDSPASREERRRHMALAVLQPLLEAVRMLAPLGEPGLLVSHIATVVDWLRRYDRAATEDDGTRSRRLRVRSAVVGALTSLALAYTRHDPAAEGDAATLSAAIRRWLGSQTFAVQSGEPGLQIVDAQAARYADFDDVQIVGVIEGEWPERPRRNVLYPSGMLALLEPLPAIADPRQRERDLLKAARAQFRDLVLSPATRVRLSTFALEHDAVVEPSVLLDDVPALALPTRAEGVQHARVTHSEALAVHPRRGDFLPAPKSAWADVRLRPDPRPAVRLRGDAGPWRLSRVSISRLELFLNCPFKFFAAQVLKLEEPPADEVVQTPLERGRFLHELWERFFDEWQRRGHGRIDPDHIDEARRLFAEVAGAALATLPPAEAALEQQRLLGSAVDAGIAHRVFAMEAGRPTRIVERLLEFPLEGTFVFRRRDGTTREVSLNAKTDRIDVLDGGAIRVIDYKSKQTPDMTVALQLPIYARLARDVLQRTRGGTFVLNEALYLSFEGQKPVVPLRPAKGHTLDDVIADAEDRALTALECIAAGEFPPRPQKKSLCGPCAYRTVCRLDIVEPSNEAADG